MIHAEGTPFDELTTAIDAFHAKIQASSRRVMSKVASHLDSVRVAAAEPEPQPPPPAVVSLETLGLIATYWAVEVEDVLFPLLVANYIRGAFALADSATGAGSQRPLDEVTEADLLNAPTAVDYLADAKNRLLTHSDAMWEAAHTQLLEGFLEGESIDELTERVLDVTDLTDAGAEMFARSEVVSASNAGSLGMVKEAGFTGTKRWLHTDDDRTRFTHEHVIPVTVPINEPFNVGGADMQFPGDPTGPIQEWANCRCTLIYQLDTPQLPPLISTGDNAMGMDHEWIGVLIVEGIPTGDGRMFAPNSLTWADMPLPLLWQKSIANGHDNSVIVGNIEKINRNGNMIIGRGRFDMNSTDGAEAYRMVRDGFLKGISADADNVAANDVEYRYGPGIDAAGGPVVEMTVVHGARIRGATLCAIPAFVEAQVSLLPTDPVGEQGPVGAPWIPSAPPLIPDHTPTMSELAITAAAVPPHETPTSDRPWDSGKQLKRMDSPITVAQAKDMFAWYDSDQVEDGEMPKGAGKLPHHEVSEDGEPGAANLAACSAGLAALHGGRGGVNIPDSQKAATYRHLASHLEDAGREVAPFEPAPRRRSRRVDVDIKVDGPGMPKVPAYTEDTLTAAAYTLVIPDVPPAEWFEEPPVGECKGALTVTDHGRVYGYLAPAGVAHRSFTQRVTVPMGTVDYSLYMGRETLVEGGNRVVTGALTMDCGHASTSTNNSKIALDHYDNACSIVATVRIGENTQGVWVAGAIVPGVTASQITRMMACQLSGDWRPHRERKGWREFAGALLVPVPGFAMARTAASVRLDEGQLVASSVPVEYEETTPVVCQAATTRMKMRAETVETDLTDCGCFSRDDDLNLLETMNFIAATVGLGPAARIETLKHSINQRSE